MRKIIYKYADIMYILLVYSYVYIHPYVYIQYTHEYICGNEMEIQKRKKMKLLFL